jgi:hypothetical protein
LPIKLKFANSIVVFFCIEIDYHGDVSGWKRAKFDIGTTFGWLSVVGDHTRLIVGVKSWQSTMKHH